MMIDSSNDVSLRIQNRVISPHKKENAPLPLFLTASTPAFQPLRPHPQRILQSNWLNVTTKPAQPAFTKVLSPKSFHNAPGSSKQPRIIQLGGSKQKRESRERNSSISEAQTQRNQLSASDTLSRRVAMLESRVKELHLEKQQLAIDLTQKNKVLESQNERLNALLKELSSQKVASQTPTGSTQEEFNLQEELSNQININLELRQELETVKRELQGIKQNYTSQRDEFNSASQEYADLKLQFIQFQDSSHDQVQQLQTQIQALKTSLEKKEAATIQMVQEREKRILQLQDQNFSLSKKLQEEQKQRQALNQQISTLNAEILSQKLESQNLKGRLCELQKPVECKKCKQLLHTVFRLNSQLNRK